MIYITTFSITLIILLMIYSFILSYIAFKLIYIECANKYNNYKIKIYYLSTIKEFGFKIGNINIIIQFNNNGGI